MSFDMTEMDRLLVMPCLLIHLEIRNWKIERTFSQFVCVTRLKIWIISFVSNSSVNGLSESKKWCFLNLNSTFSHKCGWHRMGKREVRMRKNFFKGIYEMKLRNLMENYFSGITRLRNFLLNRVETPELDTWRYLKGKAY